MSAYISEEWMDQNRKALGLTVLCPKCLNIEPAVHVCGQCSGWGFVKPGPDAECIHNWKEISQKAARPRGIYHPGMCYHVYACPACGSTMSRDSSG